MARLSVDDTDRAGAAKFCRHCPGRGAQGRSAGCSRRGATRQGSSPASVAYVAILTVRAVKLYADGALGSRGAALLAPYSDDPGNTGLLVSSEAHLAEVAKRARAVPRPRQRRPRP